MVGHVVKRSCLESMVILDQETIIFNLVFLSHFLNELLSVTLPN